MAVVVALSVAFLAGTPASAQEDPYGSTTTTRPPGGEPSCHLRTRSGVVGSRATVTVRAVPRGTTVRVLFDGQQVAEGQATGPGSSPRMNIDIDFTVPEAEPGAHEVTAVGVDFSVSCRTGTGARFEVLASGESRGGGGSLARTGVYVGLLVAVAGALLVAGRALLVESKRRRRRAGRSAGAPTRTGV